MQPKQSAGNGPSIVRSALSKLRTELSPAPMRCQPRPMIGGLRSNPRNGEKRQPCLTTARWSSARPPATARSPSTTDPSSRHDPIKRSSLSRKKIAHPGSPSCRDAMRVGHYGVGI
jgi:hypothetical protein